MLGTHKPVLRNEIGTKLKQVHQTFSRRYFEQNTNTWRCTHNTWQQVFGRSSWCHSGPSDGRVHSRTAACPPRLSLCCTAPSDLASEHSLAGSGSVQLQVRKIINKMFCWTGCSKNLTLLQRSSPLCEVCSMYTTVTVTSSPRFESHLLVKCFFFFTLEDQLLELKELRACFWIHFAPTYDK